MPTPPGTAVTRLTSVTTKTGRALSTCGTWEYLPLPDGHCEVLMLATGQRAEYLSQAQARRATENGVLVAFFAKEDAAAMALPCPGGCGRPAAAVVNTKEGPKPVCAVHRPVAEDRGYKTRVPANIDTVTGQA